MYDDLSMRAKRVRLLLFDKSPAVFHIDPFL